jgi:hypothetical protein
MAVILTKGMSSSGNRMLVKGLGAVGTPPTFVRRGFLDRFPINQMLARKPFKNSGFIHAHGRGN